MPESDAEPEPDAGPEPSEPLQPVSSADAGDIDKMVMTTGISEMFRDRVYFESPERGRQLDDRVEELCMGGMTLSQAWAKAGKEFGRKRLETERRLYRVRLTYAAKREGAKQDAGERSQKRMMRSERQLMTFLKTLPVTAAIDTEMNWIGAHPAMNRKLLSKTPGLVRLTLDDMKDPPQGPAPSQRAVIQLRHWVNHPTTFFTKLVGEHAKAKNTREDPEDEDNDQNTEDIDRMLGL